MKSRTTLLIGSDAVNKLQNANVIVFGIGGVGGHIAEMLVRAGVENISLVDFDKVTVSNINRQIIALHSTIGKYKVDVMRERLLDINPNANIITYKEKYTGEAKDTFFNKKYDYVIDAIDDVANKVDLIYYCKTNNIPIISAMGAGNRYSVPEFKIADISKTYNDGLCKVVRKKLRELGITKHTVAFTDYIATKSSGEIGSISFYPAMCGCVISGFVINELIK